MNQLELIKLCFCLFGIGLVLRDMMQAFILPLTGASLIDIARNSIDAAITIIILLAFYQDELEEIWRMITKDYRR